MTVKQCKGCIYMEKMPDQIGAYQCFRFPPVPFPVMNAHGQVGGVLMVRPGVTDDTPGCHEHREAPRLTVVGSEGSGAA